MYAEITRAIYFISKNDTFHRFSNELTVIQKTTYRQKQSGGLSYIDPRNYLFPGFNTTWGKSLVYLDPLFFSNAIGYQAASLVHEATHQLQIDRLGLATFLMNYVNLHVQHGYQQNPFEIEAYNREKEFLHIMGVGHR